jgi:hypothetical protein
MVTVRPLEVTWENLWTLDGLVALGTIGLATATVILAVMTFLTAKQTRQLAHLTEGEVEAVKEQATVSRAALQASYRPLLVGMSPDLPQFAQPEKIHYLQSGQVAAVTNRGEVHIHSTGATLYCSVPFWNVGNGVALVIGCWLRPLDDSTRVTGGPSMGIVPPGELARLRLEAPPNEPLERGIADNRALIFGVQYQDFDGEQMGWSEVRVSLGPDDKWRAGRTELFRSGDTEPYAFGGW